MQDLHDVARPGIMVSQTWPRSRETEGATLGAIEAVLREDHFAAPQTVEVPYSSERKKIARIVAERGRAGGRDRAEEGPVQRAAFRPLSRARGRSLDIGCDGDAARDRKRPDKRTDRESRDHAHGRQVGDEGRGQLEA